MVTSPRELQIIWWGGGGVVCEAFFSPYIFQQYRSAARASLKRERESRPHCGLQIYILHHPNSAENS